MEEEEVRDAQVPSETSSSDQVVPPFADPVIEDSRDSFEVLHLLDLANSFATGLSPPSRITMA